MGLIIGVAYEFVDEGLPVADDVEGGEPVAFLALYLDDAVGDVRVGRDAFLLEGHQGAAHVGGGGNEERGDPPLPSLFREGVQFRSRHLACL